MALICYHFSLKFSDGPFSFAIAPKRACGRKEKPNIFVKASYFCLLRVHLTSSLSFELNPFIKANCPPYNSSPLILLSGQKNWPDSFPYETAAYATHELQPKLSALIDVFNKR